MALKSTRDILERKVLTQDGREVGQVEQLEIEISSWEVKNIEVRLRRDALEALHIKRPMFGTRTTRIGVERVSGLTDAVVLKTSMEELGSILANLEEKGEEQEEGSDKRE